MNCQNQLGQRFLGSLRVMMGMGESLVLNYFISA